MHVQSITPLLLLLTPLVAGQRYINSCPLERRNALPEVLKRTLYVPRAIASPPIGLKKRELSLFARQSGCPLSTQVECFTFDGCCDAGTVCGIYGGETGCCPIGESCDGVSGCDSDSTTCGDGCCPNGYACGNDNGDYYCDDGSGSSSGGSSSGGSSSGGSSSGGSSGNGCSRSDYSPCPDESGCCPTGSTCLSNGQCDVPCTSANPVCGSGCCPIGDTCDENEQCISPSSGSGGLSSGSGLSSTRTSTTSTRTSTRNSSLEEDTPTPSPDDFPTTTEPTSDIFPATTSTSRILSTPTGPFSGGSTTSASASNGLAGLITSTGGAERRVVGGGMGAVVAVLVGAAIL